jgi:hypothetical protein
MAALMANIVYQKAANRAPEHEKRLEYIRKGQLVYIIIILFFLVTLK